MRFKPTILRHSIAGLLRRQNLPRHIGLIASAAILSGSLSASGANWDGGPGTWGTSAVSGADHWDGGQFWTQGNPAAFAGAAGIVTLGEDISASSISLNTNNYSINLNGFNLTVSGTTGGTAANLTSTTITNTGGTTVTFTTGTLSNAGPKLSGNMNVVYNGAGWIPTGGHDFTGTLSLLGSGTVRSDGFDLGTNTSGALLRLGGTTTLQLGTTSGVQSRTYARNIELLNTSTTAGIQTGGVQTLTLSGEISGVGNFNRFAGQGMVILTGNNTFTGKVSSTTGNAVIVAGSATAFGAANVDPLLNVVDGGGNSNTIGFIGGVDVNGAKNIVMGGAIRPDGLGTYQNFGGNNSFAGNITMNNQQMFVIEPGSQLTLKGVLGGARPLFKQGEGTLVLANAMTYGITGNGEFRRLTRVINGTLSLDFSQATSPQNDIINQAHDVTQGSEASLAGGILQIKGKNSIDNSQWFQSWRVDTGASSFNIVNGAGNNVNVTLRGMTTRVVGGTVDFGLASGTQVVNTNGFNTTKLNTNGTIGGFATANKTAWATSGTSGTNAITAYSHTAAEQGAAAFGTATNNVDITADNTAALVSTASVNSLRFSAGGTLAVDPVSTLTLTSGGILVTGAAAATITGGTLQGAASTDLIIHQFSTAPLTVASTISDNTAATALTKSGTGTLILSGTNNYTGTTFVHAGVLKLDSAGALPANSHLSLRGGVVGLTADFSRSVGSAATNVDWLGSGGFAAYGDVRNVNLGGASVTVNWNNNSTGSSWESGTAGTIATEGMYNAGQFVGSNYKLIFGASDATGMVNFQNGLNLAGGNNVPLSRTVEVIDSPSVAVEAQLSGIVSATNFTGLTKTGAGTLSLSGANTYLGPTTIQEGTLSASSIVVSGGASNLGNANTAVVLGGASTTGTLSYTGNSAIFTRGFSTQAGGGRIDTVASGQTLTIQTGAVSSAANGALTIGGAGNTTIFSVIQTGTGTLTKVDSGTLTLSGSNTYTGLTTVSAGKLQYGANNVISTGGVTVNGATAILDLAAQTDTVGTVTVDGGGSIIGTGTLTSTGSFEMKSGSVAANLAGANIPLHKTTGGAVILSGPNSYTGPTTVTGGTLEIAGSVDGSSSIEVGSGGTLLLSASNAVNGNSTQLDSNSTLLLAGSSVTESLGALILATDTTINFGAGNTNSLIFASLTNSLTFAGPFSIRGWTGSVYGSGDTADNGDLAQDRLLFNSDPGFSEGQLSQISFFNDAGTLVGTGAREVTFGGSQFELVPIVAIPEPSSTALLGAAGLVGLIGFRERRRARQFISRSLSGAANL